MTTALRNAGSSVSATLRQWLEWAEVELDVHMDAQPEFAHDPIALESGRPAPMLRMWGLEVSVRVLYFNHGLATDLTLNRLISRQRTCILEVRPGSSPAASLPSAL
jgi:hypothetical protein